MTVEWRVPPYLREFCEKHELLAFRRVTHLEFGLVELPDDWEDQLASFRFLEYISFMDSSKNQNVQQVRNIKRLVPGIKIEDHRQPVAIHNPQLFCSTTLDACPAD